MFDTLYWLGTRQHCSWALKTSAGIIIIDTNFAWATQPEILDGLAKLKLNPKDIKYVVLSHAHGDHDQGVATLQSKFGASLSCYQKAARTSDPTQNLRGKGRFDAAITGPLGL